MAKGKKHTPEQIVSSLREIEVAVARKPWKNGYCESLNSKLRDEFLNGRNLLRRL